MPVAVIPVRQLGPDRLKGQAEYRTGRSPRLSSIKRAIYVPAANRPERSGVFWPDGRAVADAVLRRGETEMLWGYSDDLSEPRPVTTKLPGTSFFLGKFPGHYGHFMLELLARMWPVPNLTSKACKYVYHGPMAPEQIFRLPYVGFFFARLGLRVDSLVRVVAPTEFDELLVAEPSFQIRHHVYPEYFKLHDYVFKQITVDIPGSESDRPLYLSKAKLRRGVSKILNENDIESYLHRKKVRIIYPETMEFIDQVVAIASHQIIIGTEGSALHTSVIDPQPKQIFCISHSEKINSNFILIDKGRRNGSVYLFPAIAQARDQSFGHAALIQNTDEVNRAICRRLQL